MKVPNMTAMAMIQGLTCGTADAESADGVGVSVTGVQPRRRDDSPRRIEIGTSSIVTRRDGVAPARGRQRRSPRSR
jgi:hypothetical protein